MLKKTIPLLLVLFAFAANSFAQQGEMLQYQPLFKLTKPVMLFPGTVPTLLRPMHHDIHLSLEFLVQHYAA